MPILPLFLNCGSPTLHLVCYFTKDTQIEYLEGKLCFLLFCSEALFYSLFPPYTPSLSSPLHSPHSWILITNIVPCCPSCHSTSTNVSCAVCSSITLSDHCSPQPPEQYSNQWVYWLLSVASIRSGLGFPIPTHLIQTPPRLNKTFLTVLMLWFFFTPKHVFMFFLTLFKSVGGFFVCFF